MTSHAPLPFRQNKRIVSLWVTAVAFLSLLIVSRPYVNEAGSLDIVLDYCGLLLLLAGISGRLWSILYIGGKKNRELITTGPYAMTRNPLYFFSVVAILGICLMYGSILVASVASLTVLGIFTYTAQREARYLEHRFGAQYLSYAQVTPLFWPRVSLVRSPSEIMITMGTLKSTFKDALFFVAFIPVVELLEYLHLHGYVPTLFMLP